MWGRLQCEPGGVGRTVGTWMAQGTRRNQGGDPMTPLARTETMEEEPCQAEGEEGAERGRRGERQPQAQEAPTAMRHAHHRRSPRLRSGLVDKALWCPSELTGAHKRAEEVAPAFVDEPAGCTIGVNHHVADGIERKVLRSRPYANRREQLDGLTHVPKLVPTAGFEVDVVEVGN